LILLLLMRSFDQGKTLQTISLLAYLACYKGIWGPHLVIVPTSVIINWETELKRFCPGLKVLCYYGSAKRRKELRRGWTKTNCHHVVVTSYQLAVLDAFAFKRKKWYYLILDEAQNIKNFQSQRWQTLVNFNTQRRLLLTGTPLQNSLMELWSLLHFLMPYIFSSRKEFSYWFSNPMNSIIEGTASRNDDVIKRLHGIIRPFVLRRLKKDVETQMPGKYEHIVKCQLSRRQMTLYEEFLSRSSTRQALRKGGNFMGMMNVLMQLRKVCNHPDLFEPRSVITPFVLPSIRLQIPRCCCDIHEEIRATTNRLSERLVKPLWVGSSGLPSLNAALNHNHVEAAEICRLRAEYKSKNVPCGVKDCPVELVSLLSVVHKVRRKAEQSKASFQNSVNRVRCDTPPFIYSGILLDRLLTEIFVFERNQPVELVRRTIVETPSPLLSLRKSTLERAIDLEETIEKFVFCVPSAGAMPLVLEDGRTHQRFSKSVEAMLVEPIEEFLKPFRKAHARLSSFFPDKKLVQYDAGKLQTLAQLLRTLKQGGHRALVFTQMSKMLDILEAFLNIHGFTYLRLDGATGVDRRQRYMDRFNNDTKIFCFILSTRSGGTCFTCTFASLVLTVVY
jgi:SNF2 family DNA or RNA helicase